MDDFVVACRHVCVSVLVNADGIKLHSPDAVNDYPIIAITLYGVRYVLIQS